MLESFEVPEVLVIPDPAPNDFNAVASADFLITALLRKQRGLLHAELLDTRRQDEPNEVVSWNFRDATQNEEMITQIPVRFFRTTLARFGWRYMSGQVYGGHVRRPLTQKGDKFICEIFMSNQNWPGCWIRIYIAPMPH